MRGCVGSIDPGSLLVVAELNISKGRYYWGSNFTRVDITGGGAPSLGRRAVSEDVKHGLQRTQSYRSFVVVVAEGVRDGFQDTDLHEFRGVGVAGLRGQ